MIKDLQAIVLAAGKATRFNTGNTKLIEKICGQEMVVYTTRMLEALSIPTTLVVGYQKEFVIEAVSHQNPHVLFVEQHEQLGTGHALACSKETWSANNLLVMNGDMPLVTPQIIEELWNEHTKTNADISFVTAHDATPTSKDLGRVIRQGEKVYIVEAKNFKGDVNEHCCINAGIYLIKRSFLEQYINSLERDAIGREFYITDLIQKASDHNRIVTITKAPFDIVRGINTFEELWAAEHIKRAELIRYWMTRGVRFSSPMTVHIGLDVIIGQGTSIGCSAHITGHTTIGKNCRIKSFATVKNSTLDEDVTVHPHTIIDDSIIGAHSNVGPFAHINKGTVLGAQVTIGNFVETKNSTIGDNSKAKHLSYLGNAKIGSKVNIGAGTITCNYDGKQKHETVIGDNVFIGSNNSIVAPVTIEKNAFTAAGSTITDNVPEGALAIGRARQVVKEHYANKLQNDIHHDVESTDEKKSDKLSFIGAQKTTNDSLLR